MRNVLTKILFSIVLFYLPITHAELTIEITKGVETAVPIAIVPFGWPQGKKSELSTVIQSDLKRSGLFKTLAERDMLTKPTDSKQIRYRNWQALGQEYLVVGQVKQVVDRFQVQFQLLDVYKSEQLLGYRFDVAASQLRKIAHHISDRVYEKLIGKKGVFSTRIAYVTSKTQANKRKLYKLLVADADGFNPRTIASSVEPLMSPSWSYDGEKIAYVSFERRRPAIFIQTLASGKREKIAAYKGINGAPAFSPDGSKLALTLSKDGSPDIYILDLRSKRLKKLTKSYGIDTEPSWSPDGKTIVYTSDRGGKPQLYTIPSSGGKSKRLTFDGDYNARGQFSANGKSIAMVHANGGDYRIAVMDLASKTVNVLTAGRYDESPSFSPNGDMILYASKKRGKGRLSAISVDGGVEQNLAFDSGEVREPSWSP